MYIRENHHIDHHTSFSAKYGNSFFIFESYFFASISQSGSGSRSVESLPGESCISVTGDRSPFSPSIVIRIRDRRTHLKSPYILWNNIRWCSFILTELCKRLNMIYTSIILRTASRGSWENCLGRRRRPSEHNGSELNPTTGMWFRSGISGLALPAVIRNVPSPPMGTRMSAHWSSFFDRLNLQYMIVVYMLIAVLDI